LASKCWTCLPTTVITKSWILELSVAKNGCILPRLNFVKTGDEVKSQHENSRERERERVLNLPTYYDNHKELNIRVIRSTVPQNGYILLHLNFVKTVDEIKSQHGNSTQRIKKRDPTKFVVTGVSPPLLD